MAQRKPRLPVTTHDEIFGEIMTGLGEALSFARGELAPGTYRVHVPVDVDVKAVRKKTGLSQEAFAGMFGFSPGTVRDWEQRRRTPDQAARMYLWAIGQRPDTMREILDPLTGRAAAAVRPSGAAARKRVARR